MLFDGVQAAGLFVEKLPTYHSIWWTRSLVCPHGVCGGISPLTGDQSTGEPGMACMSVAIKLRHQVDVIGPIARGIEWWLWIYDVGTGVSV